MPRSALAWTDNSGNRWMAAGTASNLHIYNDAGSIYDITPTGFTAGRKDASAETGLASSSWNTRRQATECVSSAGCV